MTSAERTFRDDPALPGPRGIDALKLIPAIRRNPVTVMFELMRRYGDTFALALPGREFYVFTRPDDVAYILKEKQKNFEKGPDYRFLSMILGRGLLTSEGKYWLTQRRRMQPIFRRPKLGQYVPAMVHQTERLLEQWSLKGGQSFDIANEMMQLTLRILGQTVFGADLSAETELIGSSLETGLRYVKHRVRSIISLDEHFPTRRNAEFRKAIEQLDTLIYRIIRDRRCVSRDTPDLLGLLIQLRDGESMSDRQLRDELVTFLLAGHETTANALSWTFYLLSKHPAIEQKLVQHVNSVVGDRGIEAADIERLDYVQQVVKEAMRLYPPAWSIQRQALTDDQIGRVNVPKGAKLMVLPILTHRLPDHWHNPEGFDPDRFLPEHDAARHRFAYFPFGAGRRVCIGMHFAMMEATVILAEITRRYHLSLSPGETGETSPMVTLRPKHGISMTVFARQ